jgi:hypothetical protein
MTNAPTQTSRDWLGSVRTSLLAWWMPKANHSCRSVCSGICSRGHLDHRPHLDGHGVHFEFEEV